MSFFNPFRKNAHSGRVKLSGMTQPEEGEATPEARAEPTLGGADRREPSLSQSASGLQGPAFRALAAQDDVPPPFAFSESPAPAPAAAPAAAQSPAPWDPYGIHGAGRTPEPSAAADPLTGALPDSVSAEPSPALTVPPPPAPAPRAEHAETAPAAAAEPVIPAAPAASSAAPAAEVLPEPEKPQTTASENTQEGLKPAMQPVPREQIQPSAGEKPRARPARRALTEAELTARRRTRHRMVGAAVILMAAVVAAPFVLDSDPPIDTEKLESVSTDIPKESETSTALAAAPAAQGGRAEAGDVDVTDTSLGRKESTAKANLAREAKGTDAARSSEPVKNAGEKPGAARAPDKKAEKPAQAAGGQAKSAGITPPTGSGWYVQILATSNEEAAERVVRKLALLGLPAYRTTEGGSLWKVRAGLFGTQKEAEGARGTVVLNGIAQKPYIRKQ